VMFSPAGSRAASNTRATIREARRIVVQAQGRGTLVDFGIAIVNSAGLEIDVYTSLSAGVLLSRESPADRHRRELWRVARRRPLYQAGRRRDGSMSIRRLKGDSPFCAVRSDFDWPAK
jgi:hypothetical protein